jgi:hypothetical protein
MTPFSERNGDINSNISETVSECLKSVQPTLATQSRRTQGWRDANLKEPGSIVWFRAVPNQYMDLLACDVSGWRDANRGENDLLIHLN